jgi:LPXTG-motif cell wall-anchored protein
MRRAITMLITAALFVVVWVSTAVAQTDYPLPPPAGPGAAAPARAGQLPRTGGSNTPSLVLIGIAALVVGLVLVLAVRRRRAVARGAI